MTQITQHVLDPNCPWYSLKAIRLPKVRWCEQEVCSWIESPADTWSNVGYVLFGLLIIRMAKSARSRCIQFYGPAAIIVGVTSFIYHATNSFVLQILDYLGMYVFCFLVLMVNLLRLGRWNRKYAFAKYWAFVIGFTGVTVALDFTAFPIQGVIFSLILGIIASEMACRTEARSPYPWRNFGFSLVFLVIAVSFSFMDYARIFCDPDNHWLQGHAIWHLTGSAALFFSFLHNRQFDDQLV